MKQQATVRPWSLNLAEAPEEENYFLFLLVPRKVQYLARLALQSQNRLTPYALRRETFLPQRRGS